MTHLKKFLKDRRGVSPVIGTILMVAVTVLMAAVIAAFVFGYIGTTEQAPNVALSASNAGGGQLMIKHHGGAELIADEWKASVTRDRDSATDFTYQGETGVNALTAGDTLIVSYDTTADQPTDNELLTAGWHRVVIVHIPTDTVLLDTNAMVTGSQATVTLSITAGTGGSVTQPDTVAAGETETFTYTEGEVVDLVAVADEGYEFTEWTGDIGTIDDENAAETTITMNDDYSITANFDSEASGD